MKRARKSPEKYLVPDFDRQGPVYLAQEIGISIPGEESQRFTSSRVIMNESSDGKSATFREFVVITNGFKTIVKGYSDFETEKVACPENVDDENFAYLRNLGDGITEVFTPNAEIGIAGEGLSTIEFLEEGVLIDPNKGLLRIISQLQPEPEE